MGPGKWRNGGDNIMKGRQDSIRIDNTTKANNSYFCAPAKRGRALSPGKSETFGTF